MDTIDSLKEVKHRLHLRESFRYKVPSSAGLQRFVSLKVKNPYEGYVFNKSRKALQLYRASLCLAVTTWKAVRHRRIVVLKQEVDHWYLYFLPGTKILRDGSA